MITTVTRQIKFNEFEKMYLEKVIDLLTDIDTIMLQDAVESDDYNACTQVDMIDSNTGEVIAIRSQIEDVAMMLSNLYVYVAESVNQYVSVECKANGTFSCEEFDLYR